MTSTSAHLHSTRGRAAAMAIAIAVLATACAGAPPKRDVFWPDPPEKTRIKLVRSIRGEGDLKTGFWFRLSRMLFASNSKAVAYPTGIAIDPSERFLYVAGPARVVRIDLLEGHVVDAVKRMPRGAYGLAVDGEGLIYVGDHRGNEIWIYDPNGNPVAKLGQGVLEHPTGLAIDRRAQILYAISGIEQGSNRHVIEAFSLKGEHLRTIGARGVGPGEFNYPVNIAVGAEGRIHVTDMLNFRVQTFERDGQPYGVFGEAGVGAPAQFQKLKGIAVDSFGNIHVSDSLTGNVQVFNSRFHPLIAYGGPIVPMVVPTAIAIDSKNRIYVADYGGHAVHELELVNTTAAECLPQDDKEKAKPAVRAAAQGEKGTDTSPAATDVGAKPATGSQPATRSP